MNTLHIQTGNVMKLIFVWSEEKHLMMEEWRYVWMEGGAQCAMTDGTSEILKLCVNNSGIMDVSLYLSLFMVSCYCLLLLPASYPQLSPSSRTDPLYVLDDVHCMGTETKLSDCSHSGVGVYDCYSGEAGVICTSKFMFIYVKTEIKFVYIFQDVTCEEGTVHLVGGDDMSRGRVLYCYNGTWYSVCSDDWNTTGDEARMFCAAAGHDSPRYGKTLWLYCFIIILIFLMYICSICFS